jgi:cyclase
MLKHRLIAILILRKGQVVQSVRFQHTNVIHYDPTHAVKAFNRWAVDEIAVINVDREPEGRDVFVEALQKLSNFCFVPVAAGGWITDEDYAQTLLRTGADKLIVNTAVHDQPALVKRLVLRYGRQCVVASIDVKRSAAGSVRAVIDRGRRETDCDPIEAAELADSLGAGEILLNSIDHDGARKGYDLETLGMVCRAVSLPVIAFGGVFTWEHLVEGIKAGASAVAAANIFHYTEHSARKAKKHLADAGIAVRSVSPIEMPKVNRH